MKDASSEKTIRVYDHGTGGAYIRVWVNQLDEVKKLLDGNQVPYWVDELVISLNGGPEVARVHIGRDGDARQVQRILDSVP